MTDKLRNQATSTNSTQIT